MSASPLLISGAPLGAAPLAMVLLHGRGGSAADMRRLAAHLRLDGVTFVTPQAPNAVDGAGSWWPESFLAPLAANQPHLDAALAEVARVCALLADAGLGPEQTVLGGFSQGACLALEHAARAGGPWRAVVGLSGGLVGTAAAPGGPSAALYGHTPKRLAYNAALDGATVRLFCHERDPHIPLARVHDTARVMGELGAVTDVQIAPGEGHALTPVGVAALREAAA